MTAIKQFNILHSLEFPENLFTFIRKKKIKTTIKTTIEFKRMSPKEGKKSEEA